MPHYYSEKQDSKLNLKKIRIRVKSLDFELYSASGVFSKEKLDKGTEVLIKNCILNREWEVLDLGCGTGVVGISVKLLYPNTKVLMSDINERAIMLSKKNIEKLKLENIDAIKSDIFSNIKKEFDAILVNPPQTAGKEVCFKIIEESLTHLKKKGLLQLVARHKKGGVSLKEKMLFVFGNVREAAKEAGYRIYVSEKN
jgi:16S rRNA (guanine1207-N2)-methyltransferase